MEIIASRPDPTYASRVHTAFVERGLPPHAAAWLTRALHPPAETIGTLQIPDCCSRPSVPICHRTTRTYSGASVTGMPVGTDWDLMIITTPGDYVGALVVVGPSGTNFALPDPPGIHGGPVFLQPGATSTEVIAVRVDRLASAELPSTGLWFANNDAGFVGFRHSFLSLTSYMTASDLYNSGTVTSGQFDGSGVDGEGFFSSSSAQYPATLVKRFRVPLNEESLLETSPGSRVAPAREGSYLPIRMFGGDFPYVDMQRADGKFFTQLTTTPWPPVSIPGVSYLGVPSPAAQSRDMGATYVAVPTGGGANSGDVRAGLLTLQARMGNPSNPVAFGDLGYTNTNCSVTIYRGLNYQASITLKILSGIEAIPDARAAIRSMAQPGAAPCPQAIEAYFELSKSLPTALPARDNSAGLLLGKILSMLPLILPRVKRAVEAFITTPPALAAAAAARSLPAPLAKRPRGGGKKKKAKKATN